MRARLALLSIVLLLLPGVARAEPGDLNVPFSAPPTSIFRYRIDVTQSRQKDGDSGPTITATQVAEVSFRVLSTRSDGYRMAMSYDKVESRSPQMKAMGISDEVADKIGKRFERTTLVYLCDLNGNPTRLENLADVKEVMAKNIGTLRYYFKQARLPPQADATMGKMVDGMEQTYASMTPDQANHMLLDDIRPLFGTTGIDLPVGGAIVFEETEPWPMTGTLLKTRGTLRLVRQDASQAVIELRTAYDRDSVREGLATALQQRADQSGGQVPERLASTIKSMENYDVQEFQTTTLRLADGWPDTMTIEHQSIIGPERRFKRTVATRLP
ncbi:hypothetical protein [Emcibacter sp. SYSU 3D8]|uniref:hypothetical protein n=1 Tax=Emcibacter sp. SYSU 3D8 TaxID=3133969 RepID=UPI0031FF1F97